MKNTTRTITPDEMALQREYAEMVKDNLPSGLYAGIMTFGCQQNVADSQRIAGMLIEMGYSMTDEYGECSLIIVNTCAIREHAELKAFSKTGQLKHLKTANPNLKIGLCGCMVQQEHRQADIRNRYPYVDFVFGTHMIYRLPQVLHECLTTGKRRIEVEDCDGYIAEGIPIRRDNPHRAFVNIMLGCDNFCTYCVVPYVRGRQRSRRREDILTEVRGLIESGCREITLLGQNVNSYGLDMPSEGGFAELIEQICTVEGDYWVRFMTSHPKDVPDRLIEVIGSQSKIERHFHLPLQSGDNRILSLMNRRYTREYYLETLDKLRRTDPDLGITTDIIVGFPSETDEEFDRTLDMIKNAKFDNIYSFIFSERKGTPAYDMDGKLPYPVKQERMGRLLELHHKMLSEINRSFFGKKLKVLVEEKNDKDPLMYTGRTSSNKLVNFKSEIDLVGQFADLTITKSGLHALTGKL